MDLKEIERGLQLEAEARPAPWHVHDYRQGDASQEDWLGLCHGAIEALAGDVVQLARVKFSALPSGMNRANLELCAFARNHLKELLEAAKTLEQLKSLPWDYERPWHRADADLLRSAMCRQAIVYRDTEPAKKNPERSL